MTDAPRCSPVRAVIKRGLSRPNPNRGKGFGVQWIRDHVNYQGDDCLKWPLSTIRGYGCFGLNGKTVLATRYMCELAHGPAPTPKHHAAHSCGQGRFGCCNPRHLSWKTIIENRADCATHGTNNRRQVGPQGRLSREQVATIRARLAAGELQSALAAEFDISEKSIGNIKSGRVYARPSKMNFWTADDDAKIIAARAAGISATKVGATLGRSKGAVLSRFKRLR